ncbi:hypothetical protein JB92DRAFT_2916654 [Gautieria morchelliformis]|nr:hypothetical protein JB92DRAFT_2916654 [Gautieria morchelliformis]
MLLRGSLRRTRLAWVSLALVFVLLCWLSTGHRPMSRVSDWIPWSSMLYAADAYPLSFKQIREYERRLPQHDTSLPPPEGIKGRTLMFSNEVWGLGLNNQLNNRLVLSHLAYLSNRSYVFHDVMFGEQWEGGVWHPLNTFISGPTAGGPFPPFANSSPRAVSIEYWLKICPSKRRTLLDVDAVNRELDFPDEPDGVMVLERWADKLKAMPETCVEISYMSKHIIDFYFFGSPRSLSLFPSFSSSPVISHFRWSDVVLHAVERNIPLITHKLPATLPPGAIDSGRLQRGPPTAAISSFRKNQALSNVLALHIRRGDYGTHCHNMATYASGYNSWNLLPSLPDVYNPPNDAKEGEAFEEFMRHCWPNVDDIVKRVRDVKRDYEKSGGRLNSIYVMTNGKQPWIDKLTERLLTSRMGWERVTSSLNLTFVSEPEKLVNQAVDMEIGKRAAVFVGNGFSTMTANIVIFRLISGMSAQTTRFW